jgi:hypothetical protein
MDVHSYPPAAAGKSNDVAIVSMIGSAVEA